MGTTALAGIQGGPPFSSSLPHPSPTPQELTSDGDGGVGFLAQQGVLHQATVSAVGLQHHPQNAPHVKEAFLVGHLGGGDVLRDVVALAVMPEDGRLGVAGKSVAGHRGRVSRLEILVGFQVQVGLRIKCWGKKGEEQQAICAYR